MVSLVVHAILGLVLIGLIVASNPKIFARPANGPRFSALECAYATGSGNPIWGDGSWAQFISLGYTNPAASNASQDYTLINVVLLPLFTIIDGRRRGIRRPWLFFVSSLFTSCVFAFAFYFATIERQRRHQQTAPEPATTVSSDA